MEASGGEGGISNTSNTSKNSCLLDPGPRLRNTRAPVLLRAGGTFGLEYRA